MAIIKHEGNSKVTIDMRMTFDMTADFIRDIFTTALEGGIGYWSAASVYKWDGIPATDFKSVIHLTEEEIDEDDPTKTFTIDWDVIVKGLDMFADAYPDRFLRTVSEEDYDAEDADMIVQLGLFEEVVYG